MKKKLAFLAAPILALGLVANPVKAEPTILWEAHEIYTRIENRLNTEGKKFTLEKRTLKKIEICLRDVDYDKFQKIDDIIKDYFETITKEEDAQRELMGMGVTFIDDSYDRKENLFKVSGSSTLNSLKKISYSAIVSGGCTAELSYLTYPDRDPSLVVGLRLPVNLEYSMMLEILKEVGIKKLPQSLKNLDKQIASYKF